MSKNNTPGARRVVPRSRGALSGTALMILGIWGALIPFVGPYFNFSFTPDKAWHWSAARGWLEVLPGAAAFVAGFLLLSSKSRMTTLIAAWLGIAAGAWFAVGLQLSTVWHIGSPGQPAGSRAGLKVLEVLALFPLLGVVIVYFAATAFGRLSVVSLRDAHAAEQREAEAAAQAERERQAAAARERDAAAEREREAAAAAAAHERRAAGEDPDANQDRDGDRTVVTPVPAERITSGSDEQSREHRAHDHRALGDDDARGSHPLGQESGPQERAQQTQPAQVQPQQSQATQSQPQQTQAPHTQPQPTQPRQDYPQQAYAQQPPAQRPEAQQPSTQQPSTQQPQQAQPQPSYAERPQTQPSQVQPQSQAYAGQGMGSSSPTGQGVGSSSDQSTPGQAAGLGYAQPQQYDPQHGYAQQTPGAQPADDEAERPSLGRRLFHRR